MKEKSTIKNIHSRQRFRYVLIIAGSCFVGLGIIGIFIPILPTTPFLLLAAACYARSSKRFYDWLLHNKWFGSYITNYREGRGITLPFKMFTIALLWLTMCISIYYIIDNFWIELTLLIIAIGVTIHILTIKTLK